MDGAPIVIIILVCVLLYILHVRVESEPRKRREHEEWMTHALDGAGRGVDGESGFRAAVRRRTEEQTSETSKPKEAPKFTIPSSPYEAAAKLEQKSESKREPFLGKGKEPIVDWDGIKGRKPSPEKVNAFAQRYRIYCLYVVLILAGVLFIPEAREWAGATVSESWVWLAARVSDAAQWVSERYAEGQATGSIYAAAARAFVVDHFTVIWQSAALLFLAGLFLKFGKKAGIVGAVGCVLVAGYLGEREYVEMQIGLPWLASLADKSTMPSKTLCGRALLLPSQDEWDHSARYEADVAEAQKRGFTVASCRLATAEGPSLYIEVGSNFLINADKRYGLELPSGQTVLSVTNGQVTIRYPDGSTMVNCTSDPIALNHKGTSTVDTYIMSCFGQVASIHVGPL